MATAIFLAANIAFLATHAGNWKGYLPLALFVGIGYVAILLMQRERWRGLFILVVATFISVFMWLKRYTFLPHATFLSFPYLLLGLSYIFFRVMHMIVDARVGSLPRTDGIVPYLNYMLNFASIVSGPIQLYSDFSSAQLKPKPRTLTLATFALGLRHCEEQFLGSPLAKIPNRLCCRTRQRTRTCPKFFPIRYPGF